jgi:hypothetical protein
MYLRSVWWRGGYGRFNGGTRALELAIISWEATQGKCTRSPSTGHVLVEPYSRVERHYMTKAGGRSQAEQRSSRPAAAGKQCTEGFFGVKK